MVSLRSLSAISTWFASVVARPITSPRPRTPSASAASALFSLAVSTWSSTPTRFSKTVLTSVVTFCDTSTWPALNRSDFGSAGYTRSTNLAPKIVVDRILASTFDGMKRIWSGSISRRSFTGDALSVSPPLMAATLPTWTPRNLTLALVSMTRPERSEVRVTGTVLRRLPVNREKDNQMAAMTNTTSSSVHQPGAIPELRFVAATANPPD
ncbi:hypothetical protein BN1047_03613 [Mycolicibacterium neoaurum]|uniref:Secreted protein n=1 Tax=Mycolicibacterium neoaurum TaxID=1795 RepID=A0AAV2WPH3_MYCNE|nr:hypothetical protein BN1047_03613 [Mycolicibacterium neoaurum]